jgi:hypothetical protein
MNIWIFDEKSVVEDRIELCQTNNLNERIYFAQRNYIKRKEKMFLDKINFCEWFPSHSLMLN